MTQTKQGVTVIDFSNVIVYAVGFFIGFFFQGLLAQKIMDAIHSTGGSFPSQIPILLSNIFFSGGIIGSIIFILAIILAAKFIKKFLPFAVWILIGILVAYLYVLFGPTIGIPNMFDWLSTTLNIK
jgi:hypothetical protein